MRFVTFRSEGETIDRAGLVVDGEIRAFERGVRLLDVIGDLTTAGERVMQSPDDVVALGDARLRAPIPEPPTVRDFYAFEEHVRTARKRRGLDMEPDWYELPVFYFSNPYAVVGPDDDVAVPPGSAELDFELEVAAVVGKAGADLSPAAAESHIAGFTIMNDWSARDVQRREMKLNMGPVKGKDSATSLGPMLVTPDELEPRRGGQAYTLTMTATVNGTEYSRGQLGDVYWSFPEMLAYASRGTWVRPGDVIGSGTCGTGCILELSLVHGAEAYPWLSPGDEVVLEVEELGVLRNRVVEGTPVRELRP